MKDKNKLRKKTENRLHQSHDKSEMDGRWVVREMGRSVIAQKVDGWLESTARAM